MREEAAANGSERVATQTYGREGGRESWRRRRRFHGAERWQLIGALVLERINEAVPDSKEEDERIEESA